MSRPCRINEDARKWAEPGDRLWQMVPMIGLVAAELPLMVIRMASDPRQYRIDDGCQRGGAFYLVGVNGSRVRRGRCGICRHCPGDVGLKAGDGLAPVLITPKPPRKGRRAPFGLHESAAVSYLPGRTALLTRTRAACSARKG